MNRNRAAFAPWTPPRLVALSFKRSINQSLNQCGGRLVQLRKNFMRSTVSEVRQKGFGRDKERTRTSPNSNFILFCLPL
jgi:hypothetical protein